MKTIIKQYSQTAPAGATFFIQCKGLHSGRPLKKPIPNCFSVYTDVPGAYEAAFAAFKSRLYEREIKGSCVPFITIDSAQKILLSFIDKINEKNRKYIDAVKLLEEQIENYKKQLELLKELQTATARQIK